ncbi:MAG: hypothetical protein ACLFT4_02045 [Bacteroidales bacterium]
MKIRYRTLQITILLIIFSFLSKATLLGQSIDVQTKLDTNEILIGDQIYFYLTAVQDKDVNLSGLNVSDKLPEEIEVIDAEDPDTISLEDGRYQVTQKYLVTSFDSGRVHIPEMDFPYETENIKDTITSPPLDLMVSTVRIDTTKTIFDIKKPFGAPLSFREILPYLGVFIALVILGLLVWYYLKYLKKKKAQQEFKKPEEPAHVIAFRELDKLKEEKLWQKDKIKLYYTKLADILRYYLWLRYDIKTLERTTFEILTSLRATGFDDERLYNMLADILRQADLVKFAKWTPTPEENKQCLEDAYKFVDQTKLEKSDIAENENKSNGNGEKTENL